MILEKSSTLGFEPEEGRFELLPTAKARGQRGAKPLSGFAISEY
jgi:hypothetical protein